MNSHGNAEIFGRNIRPGMVPGGFSRPMPQSSGETNWHQRGKRRGRCEESDTIIEAANVVIEGRQMPRAEEAAGL